MKLSKNRVRLLAIFISSFISLIIIFTLENIINLNLKKLEQQEKMNIMESIIDYKSSIEKEISSRIQLANGYLAFIKTFPEADAEFNLKYVENLIDKNDRMIKNISVLKDTTIVWTYPQTGNKSAIGKDLLKIPDQRESVLFAKNKGIVVFQGPVNLIQGGVGFISRIPAFDKQNKYWGQVSIVISGEELEKELLNFQNNTALKISLYNRADFPNKPFWGEHISEEEKPLIFNTFISGAEWVIAAVPSLGWKDSFSQYLYWNIMNVLLALIIGVLIYNYIYKSYMVNQQVNYDTLTGVHSRAFLDSYIPIVFARTKRTNTKVGVLVIDLNNFKSINDKYGHIAGDKALQTLAKNLKELCRDTDNVMRTGGDEFLMVFTDLKSQEDFDKIIKKVEEKSKISMHFNTKTIEYSYSVGASVYPDNGNTIDEIINIADKKMYFNKKNRL